MHQCSLFWLQFAFISNISLNISHVGVEFLRLQISDVNHKQHPESEDVFSITSTINDLPDAQKYFLRMHATSMERHSNTPLNAFQSYITSKTLIHVESSFLEPLTGAPSLTRRLSSHFPQPQCSFPSCFCAPGQTSLAFYSYYTHLEVHMKRILIADRVENTQRRMWWVNTSRSPCIPLSSLSHLSTGVYPLGCVTVTFRTTPGTHFRVCKASTLDIFIVLLELVSSRWYCKDGIRGIKRIKGIKNPNVFWNYRDGTQHWKQ